MKQPITDDTDITDDTRFTLTPAGYAALETAPRRRSRKRRLIPALAAKRAPVYPPRYPLSLHPCLMKGTTMKTLTKPEEKTKPETIDQPAPMTAPVAPTHEPDAPAETSLPEGVAEPELTAPVGLNIPPDEVFSPDTLEKADWVLCQIADRRARAKRIRENANNRARQEEAEAAFFEWKYGVALRELLRQQLKGKRKSLTLAHGILGLRMKAAGVQIGDPVAALAWARDNQPDLISEHLDKAGLGKALLASGEVVPFAAFTPAEEQFYIK